MPRTTSLRTYGKKAARTKPQRVLAELPQTPIRKPRETQVKDSEDDIDLVQVTEKIATVTIRDDTPESINEPVTPRRTSPRKSCRAPPSPVVVIQDDVEAKVDTVRSPPKTPVVTITEPLTSSEPASVEENLRVLTWHDVCPPGDTITQIAEASYAEVYRIRNDRGTSIIKCIRLESPIKAQTKAQARSGLVDEEPHSEDDLLGELRISEWLADIPGFVVYKERYIVEGKTSRSLLETHQAFQRKMKRQDPDRAQFYPSPSRYLETTRFLVVELGDAGVALEDFELHHVDQLWDIFFLVAVALARAEDLIAFEHRDLHEGNLCIRQTSQPRPRDPSSSGPNFGHSGLDITILDYGLSRAEDYPATLSLDMDDSVTEPAVVALDLEKDLSIFTSTHAPQCKVYRQMRSHLVHGGASRKCLPPTAHSIPYQAGISWDVSAPYTNVLWLAYTYQYMLGHFRGDKKDAARWKRDTAPMWRHLDPDAKAATPVFGSAAEVVRFGVEAGWIGEEQIMGGEGASVVEREDSIVISHEVVADGDEAEAAQRRSSPRRKTVGS
ncbi:hypothetical protein BN1708_007657 [Verticillium longisporum]|uniref:non-specific serine/threonine protein kinase n=1 Tax=Verticillium longisporum TaxID=100787 RepID=A0A0G4MV30_VERLO|nr:hypothetical protein BN1708_007657 [Verticillium longisporum]